MKSVKMVLYNMELRLRNKYYGVYIDLTNRRPIELDRLDRMMISQRIGIHRNLR